MKKTNYLIKLLLKHTNRWLHRYMRRLEDENGRLWLRLSEQQGDLFKHGNRILYLEERILHLEEKWKP